MKVLVLQFRDDDSTQHEQQCFITRSGLDASAFTFLNAITDTISSVEAVLEDVGCILMGGSGQYDLSKNPPQIQSALNKTKDIFRHILETDFPTLGVCFGFQALVHTLGGKVEPEPEYGETGTLKMTVTENGQMDKFFGKLPSTFIATEGHKESVTALPEVDNFKVLVKSDKCPVEAFSYKNNVYGVQFHPELGVEEVMYRLAKYPQYLEGRSIDDIKLQFEESHHAQQFYKSFLDLYLPIN